MARISPVLPQGAAAEVQAVYQDICRATREDWVPDFYRTLAHRPPLLEGFWKIQSSLIFKGKVSRRHREMVNVFVSIKNNCEY